MEKKTAVPKDQTKKPYHSPQLTIYGNVGQITNKKGHHAESWAGRS